MNGQNTVAVEGFKEGAQDESTTVAAQANNSHKDHITGQLLSQSKDSHKEHVAEGKVSHKDPIWSTHAAVIIKYVGAAKRFTQRPHDRSTTAQTKDLQKEYMQRGERWVDSWSSRRIHTRTDNMTGQQLLQS